MLPDNEAGAVLEQAVDADPVAGEPYRRIMRLEATVGRSVALAWPSKLAP
jgi:hypothetical protein